MRDGLARVAFAGSEHGDVDGYPVMDIGIYVDAVPPADPKPRVTSVTPGSITFTWDPLADRGD